VSTTFFHKTRKTYYTRAYIPKRLRSLLHNRLELWRSLDTANADLAALRSAEWETKLQRVFLKLKREGLYMTQMEIDQLVQQWLERELNYAEESRATARPINDDDRESQIDGLNIMLDSAYEDLLSNDYRKIDKEADELIKAAALASRQTERGT
jgi:uncharacterized protein DUF6538